MLDFRRRPLVLAAIFALLALFSSGCGPAATAIPAATVPATPTPPTSYVKPVEIAVLNSKSEVQSDGTVKNTAELSIDPLGIGTLQLTAPAKIKLGESDVIRLTITPNSDLAGLPQVTITPSSSKDQGYVLKLNDQIKIYPIMMAELKGVNFEIVSDNRPEKPVTSSSPVEWVWSVTPKSSGKQTLLLSISIPVIIDQKRNILSAQPLKNIPIDVVVDTAATPTPPPALTRIGEQLIANSATIIAASIALMGVVFTALITYLVNKNKEPKSSSKADTSKRKKKS